MKTELKFFIKNLNPKILEVDKIRIKSFKKLGAGEGNINYIFTIEGKKFVCRVRVDNLLPAKEEFNSLKVVEDLKIAPKAYYYQPKDKKFPHSFIILEFIEGKPLRMKKRNYTKKQIKEIAFILAELHSKDCTGLPKKNYSFQHYLKECEEYSKTINHHNDTLRKELNEIHNKIRKFLPKREEHKFSLIHGDVCPQNIVETKTGLILIDWESLRCADPAEDLASVLGDLGLSGSDLKIFFEEYSKTRKDNSILERAKNYRVLLRYRSFLWEITRSFEIINKKLPKEYLNKTTAQIHINEAKFQFRNLSKLIDVPKINIDSLFTGTQN